MITYNDIYEAARKERYTKHLQTLPKNFVSEVSTYLKEKKDLASREEDLFSDNVIKTKKQLENAITLFKELMRTRRKKILGLVLFAADSGISKQDFDNMMFVEKELFEEMTRCIVNSDKKVSELLNGDETPQLTKNEMILFSENVSELIDMNGNELGPYGKGDLANLPKEIAKILVDDGKAEYVVE